MSFADIKKIVDNMDYRQDVLKNLITHEETVASQSRSGLVTKRVVLKIDPLTFEKVFILEKYASVEGRGEILTREVISNKLASELLDQEWIDLCREALEMAYPEVRL